MRKVLGSITNLLFDDFSTLNSSGCQSPFRKDSRAKGGGEGVTATFFQIKHGATL